MPVFVESAFGEFAYYSSTLYCPSTRTRNEFAATWVEEHSGVQATSFATSKGLFFTAPRDYDHVDASAWRVHDKTEL